MSTGAERSNGAVWDSTLYAGNTAHHRAFDDAVLTGAELGPGQDVLDVGCGVGDFTARVAELVSPGGTVLGIDAVPAMIADASRQTRPGLRFAVCTAQDLATVVAPEAVDVVLSVACLHWVPGVDHPGILGAVRRVLRPGGTFRADFGGAGQIAAARAVLDEESARLGGPTGPWYFPTAEEYAERCAAADLRLDRGHVRLVRQRRAVPDGPALLGWLRSQVLVAYTPGLPDDTARAEFVAAAERRCLDELRRPDGTYDQDYVRLDLLAHAPF
jgi:ubiquinone/menaquinone biosynthesis C-methylase UbiE